MEPLVATHCIEKPADLSLYVAHVTSTAPSFFLEYTSQPTTPSTIFG